MIRLRGISLAVDLSSSPTIKNTPTKSNQLLDLTHPDHNKSRIKFEVEAATAK